MPLPAFLIPLISEKISGSKEQNSFENEGLKTVKVGTNYTYLIFIIILITCIVALFIYLSKKTK